MPTKTTILASLIAVFASTGVMAAEPPAPGTAKTVPGARHVKKAPAKHAVKTRAKANAKTVKTSAKEDASAPVAQ